MGLRAVLDANVYVSAAIRPEGPHGRVLTRFLGDAAFEIVLSSPIIEEVLRALAYPQVLRYLRAEKKAESWFEDVVVLADVVSSAQRLSGVCADPDDDKYVAAALEGRAGYVVTGDGGFPALGEYDGIRIVSPRSFHALLDT